MKVAFLFMIKITGKVIRGKDKGKQLGFPTVNLRLEKKLASGVYSGIVKLKDKRFQAGIFVNRNGDMLEAHLLGWRGDLYGQEIAVAIGKKIREIMEFKSDEDASKQIKKDMEKIK